MKHLLSTSSILQIHTIKYHKTFINIFIASYYTKLDSMLLVYILNENNSNKVAYF
jgi:hypothetical protein